MTDYKPEQPKKPEPFTPKPVEPVTPPVIRPEVMPGVKPVVVPEVMPEAMPEVMPEVVKKDTPKVGDVVSYLDLPEVLYKIVKIDGENCTIEASDDLKTFKTQKTALLADLIVKEQPK